MTIETQALQTKWVDDFAPILKALDKIQKEFKAAEVQIRNTGRTSVSAFKPFSLEAANVIKNIIKVRDSFAEVTREAKQSGDSMVLSFRPVSAQTGKVIRGLVKTREALNSIESQADRVGDASHVAFKNFSKEAGRAIDKTEDLSSELKKLDSQMSKTGKNSQVAFKPMPVQTGKAAAGISAITSGLGGLVTGLGVAGLAFKAFDIGLQSITAASDRMEENNKASLVFGDNLRSVQSELKAFGKLANSTQGELTQFATGFGVVFNAFEIGSEQSRDMSVTLTKLSADFASLNNLKGGTAEASERLQKTLAGEHENAKALQIIINESIIKQELQAMGMEKLTGMELERAKVMARYNIILRQSTLAQGDAIRTADGFANSTRGLKANIQELSENLGSILLPVAEDIVWAMKEATAATSEAVKIAKDLSNQVNTINELQAQSFVNQTTAAAESLANLLDATGEIDATATSEQIRLLSGDINELINELIISSDSFEDYQQKVQKLGQVSAPLAQQIELTKEQFTELNAEVRQANAQTKIAEINAEFERMARQRAFALNVVNGLEEIAAAANSSLFEIKGINEELIIAAQQDFLRETRAAPFMATSLETGQANKQLEENKKRREKEQEETERSLKSLTTAADSFASSMESVVSSIVDNAFGILGKKGVSFLPNEDDEAENAARLADIALGRFDSAAAKSLEKERPDLFKALFASGDPAAMAQGILADFERGIDAYGLIDINKAIANAEKIIIGQQSREAVSKAVIEGLVSKGFDEATAAQALGDKMAEAQQALSGGLVDAEHQLKLQELTSKVETFGDSSEMATDKLKTGIESTRQPIEGMQNQLDEVDRVWASILYSSSTAIGIMQGAGLGLGIGGEGNTTAPPPVTSGPPPISAPSIATPSVAPSTIPQIAAIAQSGAVNTQPLSPVLDLGEIGRVVVNMTATMVDNKITRLTRA